ncbi:MAG: N-acetyltransferase family protein [Rhizobiaceae bacterium]
MSAILVRPIQKTDHDEWRRLWTAYLAFYETTVAEDVYRSTWARLFDDGHFEPRGLIAEIDGNAVGLVHYIMHRTCWSTADNCYLQDLYADPHMRGKGVGRALIEAVRDEADRLGANAVYWMTHETNATARKLYDRVGRDTGFVKYTI